MQAGPLKQKHKKLNIHMVQYTAKGGLNMEIELTADAIERIKEKTEGHNGYLKLKYDTDGCGCAVNGVTVLWFVPELDETDVAVKTNSSPIYIEKAKAVFFDDKMKIDFSKSTNCFQLKSPQQILNGHMSFLIKEKTD